MSASQRQAWGGDMTCGNCDGTGVMSDGSSDSVCGGSGKQHTPDNPNPMHPVNVNDSHVPVGNPTLDVNYNQPGYGTGDGE